MNSPLNSRSVASRSALPNHPPAAAADRPLIIDAFSASRLHQTALSIGWRICRDAIWSGHRCNWMGWSMMPTAGKNLPVFGNCDANIYCGTAGISLFLARLACHDDDALLRHTLAGALAHGASFADHCGPGYFTGSDGIAAALINAGELTRHSGWIEQGLSLLERTALRLDPGKITARQLDMIGGVASAIPLYLRLGERYGLPVLLRRASDLGMVLCHSVSLGPYGASWPGDMPRLHNLTGFAHGTSGIMVALCDLYHATGDTLFRDMAIAARNYDDNCFDPALPGWPDFRLRDTSPRNPAPSATDTPAAPSVIADFPAGPRFTPGQNGMTVNLSATGHMIDPTAPPMTAITATRPHSGAQGFADTAAATAATSPLIAATDTSHGPPTPDQTGAIGNASGSTAPDGFLPPDASHPGKTPPPVAWCHGAIGIGYARLHCRTTSIANTHFDDDIALAGQLASGLLQSPAQSGDFGLCHGLSGAVDFLVDVARFAPDLLPGNAADRVQEFAVLATNIGQAGLPWPCGTDGRGDNPTLTQGTSGIGMTLLRLAEQGLADQGLTEQDLGDQNGKIPSPLVGF